MSDALDWDDLRVFLAVSRAGSLRGAASELKVNHATVNRAILRLEDRLGSRIFDRSQSGLSLSQPGEILVPHAEQMERQIFDLSRKVAGVDAQPSGKVRLSIPPALTCGFIGPILRRFTQRYPEIEPMLHLSNDFEDLSRHEVDVTIRITYDVDADVVGRRLVQYMIAPYASPSYLERTVPLKEGDGEGAQWLGWTLQGTHKWVASSVFPKATSRYCFPEVAAQIEAAAEGLGIAHLPCFIGDTDKRIMRVPGIRPRPDRSIWLLLHGDLRNTARVRTLVDFIAADILSDKQRFTT